MHEAARSCTIVTSARWLDLADNFREILEDMGHEVRLFTDAERALAYSSDPMLIGLPSSADRILALVHAARTNTPGRPIAVLAVDRHEGLSEQVAIEPDVVVWCMPFDMSRLERELDTWMNAPSPASDFLGTPVAS
jgi:hypothetical protein